MQGNDDEREYVEELIAGAIEEDMGEPAECPACRGMSRVLGSLGSRVHYRCRDCGMDFSREDHA